MQIQTIGLLLYFGQLPLNSLAFWDLHGQRFIVQDAVHLHGYGQEE